MQFRFFFSIDFDINFGIFLQTADYSNYNNSINNPYKLDLDNYSEIYRFKRKYSHGQDFRDFICNLVSNFP